MALSSDTTYVSEAAQLIDFLVTQYHLFNFRFS